jgi:hypothetical protein
MTFTGYNLILVHQALTRAIDDVQSEIASCPDVTLYSDEIDDLEREKLDYERLFKRVHRALGAV